MKLVKLIFLGLGIVLINSCSNESLNENESNILDSSISYQELNIAYGNDDNQRFDLYLPENRTLNTKVMILVHGGGWSSGDKSEMNPIKDLLHQDFPEIAIVNINYRLADENNNPYPMQIEDITSVINFLKNNKTKYTISENLAFIGISAGAHLSLLWSYAFDVNSNVKMVCSIVGPTNFTDSEYLNNTNTELQALLDLYGIEPTTTFLEEISPYHRVTSSAPPTILFYGGQDPLIPTSQGVDLRDKLQSLNIINEFTLYENEGHGWVGINLLDTWLKLKNFIQVNL